MNFLSLFTGIGGLDLGLERVGLTCVGQVELDDWCRRVLAAHWPEVPRHDDVRTAAAWWRADAARPAVDVVVAGFPCQPASVAGRRRGADDERWLWPATWDVIDALRPAWVLLENVPGLLTVRVPQGRGVDGNPVDGTGIGAVLGALAEGGYDAWWDHVPASAVGAPHRRDRWLCVAADTRRGVVRDEPVSLGRGGDQAEPGGDGPPRPVADPGPQAGRGDEPRRWGAGAGAAAAPGHVANADPVGRGGRPGERGPRGRGEPADRGDGTDVADADAVRWAGRPVEPRVGDGEHRRPESGDRGPLGDAEGDRRGAGRAGRSAHAGEDGPAVEAAGLADSHGQGQPQPQGGFAEVGRRAGDGGRGELADAAGEARRPPVDGVPGAGRAPAGRREAGPGRRGECWPRPEPHLWWAAEPDLGGDPDGLPAGLDGPGGDGAAGGVDVAPWERGVPRLSVGVPDRRARLRGLGNAVVPQVAEHAGRVLLWLAASDDTVGGTP